MIDNRSIRYQTIARSLFFKEKGKTKKKEEKLYLMFNLIKIQSFLIFVNVYL